LITVSAVYISHSGQPERDCMGINNYLKF